VLVVRSTRARKIWPGRSGRVVPRQSARMALTPIEVRSRTHAASRSGPAEQLRQAHYRVISVDIHIAR
jgi:hypothetical protein